MTNNSMAVVRGFIALSDEEKDEVKKALFLSENSDFDHILSRTRHAIIKLAEIGGKNLTGQLSYAWDDLIEIERISCK